MLLLNKERVDTVSKYLFWLGILVVSIAWYIDRIINKDAQGQRINRADLFYDDNPLKVGIIGASVTTCSAVALAFSKCFLPSLSRPTEMDSQHLVGEEVTTTPYSVCSGDEEAHAFWHVIKNNEAQRSYGTTDWRNTYGDIDEEVAFADESSVDLGTSVDSSSSSILGASYKQRGLTHSSVDLNKQCE